MEFVCARVTPGKIENKRKRIGATDGDTMKTVMLECSERLMNLDHVISDDEIRSDITLIYKVTA